MASGEVLARISAHLGATEEHIGPEAGGEDQEEKRR